MVTTLTPHQRAFRSTVALKALMALTGLILIAFLLMHCFGNLKLLISAEEFNHYAHWLKGEGDAGGMLEPLIPHGWFIWIFRVFMLAAAVLHILAAVVLWRRAYNATPSNYEARKKLAQTYAARTQRLGGVILGALLLWHLLQFTVIPAQMAGQAGEPSSYVIFAFGQWYYVLCYAVFMGLVCLHVRHGFWSAFTTLGVNTSKRAEKVLNVLAYLIAALLFIGFMAMPLAVLGGIVS
ncbi:MAG: succinate dehydrogenase cytochrome b subunit [Propionibacteriaceae bacterium]|nr:succinate dehydrogenase cytochrome b subunit [Propionibacteriaceae bacterium]